MSASVLRSLFLLFLMVSASVLATCAVPKKYLADQYQRQKLQAIIPTHFADWELDSSIVPIPPSPDLQKVLDETYDETLALTFRNKAGQRIMLSLAYGRNQHKGMNTHRPEVCYPAQGFKILQGPSDSLVKILGQELQVTRLVASLQNRIEPITYWLIVGEHSTRFGYPQRRMTISYGVQGIVPDGVLVRVSTIDPNATAAFDLHLKFMVDLGNSIHQDSRWRFFGKAS